MQREVDETIPNPLLRSTFFGKIIEVDWGGTSKASGGWVLRSP
jgi:hypothetical protein